MEVKGKVHEISQVITVSEKFKKRELILEYAENPTMLRNFPTRPAIGGFSATARYECDNHTKSMGCY